MGEDCERCGREYDSLETIDVGESRDVCTACMNAVRDSIDYHDWQSRYTEEQHERALSLFDERDAFECVISSYEDGQIVLHTPYVSSDVVTDFCDHFGYEIVFYGPIWKAENDMYPCMSEHGDTFQIVLEYNHRCDPPIPTNSKFIEIDSDRVSGSDRQF